MRKNGPSKIVGLGVDATAMTADGLCAMLTDATKGPVTAYEAVASQTVQFEAMKDSDVDKLNQIQLFNLDSITGAIATDTSGGLVKNEFQTYVLVVAMGVKVYPTSFGFTLLGNSTPTPATGTAKPLSPNTYNSEEVAAGAVSLAAPIASGTGPAVLEYGWWGNLALWNLIHGANVDWTYGNNVSIINETMRHMAYLPSNAQSGSAGDLQVDANKIVADMNQYYQAQLGSLKSFMQIDQQRVGLFGGNPQFKPSNDFRTPSAMAGGIDFSSLLCDNKEWTIFNNPMLIQPGVPLTVSLVPNNLAYYNQFKQLLKASGGTGSLPALYNDGPNLTSPGAAFQELSLDAAPASVSRNAITSREVYKFGGFSLGIELRGVQITENVAMAVRNNPNVQNMLNGACGMCFTFR